MNRLRLLRRAALFALLPLLAVGCATFSERTGALRDSYASGNFAAAESAVDQLISEECGADVKTVTDSKGLSGKVKPEKGDTALLLLEKGMIRLARGDSETAVKLFRAARERLDENFLYDSGSFLEDSLSVISDDTVRTYPGADYEQIMVRAMLAIADLMSGGPDAYAYAVQIGEKQEEIIGSPLGEIQGKKGYKPRENYRRVGFGAYLQGIIREDKLIFDEAGRAYERALSFEGGTHPVFGPALERINGKNPSSGGGVLHVFEFAGEGPYLIESHENASTEALRLAGLLLLQTKHGMAVITQAPIPLPRVFVPDPFPEPLGVAVDGQFAETELLLDVNKVAKEQNEANMPWTAARAVARRTVKAVASQALGSALAPKGKGGKGKVQAQVAGQLLTATASVLTTITENADTRSWSTLPAQIRTARFQLPEGSHTVRLGGGVSSSVKITAGHASYLLVIRPNAKRPPAILVDRYSLGFF